MGDALSMCLLELNEFEAKDFAKLATVAIEDEDYPMNFMIQDTNLLMQIQLSIR